MDINTFTALLGNKAFLAFIGTYGLAVVIVLYMVFIRDPKREKYLKSQYENLSESYSKLAHALVPETREMSEDQTKRLAYIALDRDFYKLYIRICEKINGTRSETIENFLKETILDTNDTWNPFRAPFPKVLCLKDLYGVYKNGGKALADDLNEILDDEAMDDDLKREKIWNSLLDNTNRMKAKLQQSFITLKEGGEISPAKDNIALS